MRHPDVAVLTVSWELALRADGYADNTVKAYHNAVRSLAGWLAEHHPEVGPVELDRQHIRGWLATCAGTDLIAISVSGADIRMRTRHSYGSAAEAARPSAQTGWTRCSSVAAPTPASRICTRTRSVTPGRMRSGRPGATRVT
jgi:hypothetical protein